MRGKIKQLVLSSGREQTDPFQPLSFHGTRIVTWCGGRRRAPSDSLVIHASPQIGCQAYSDMLLAQTLENATVT
jgi:hypothetical protein